MLPDSKLLVCQRFEDTSGTIRSHKSKKTDNTMTKGKPTREQAIIYKTLHRKLKIEQCVFKILDILVPILNTIQFYEKIDKHVSCPHARHRHPLVVTTINGCRIDFRYR